MDIFDIIAFACFAVLIAAAVVIIVGLGLLPGAIARKRGHPQTDAVNVAGWLGVATLGILWPLALIWAFPQNYLMNVQSGDDVELIINTYPGRLFKAKVDTVIPATGEGQYDPSKVIPEAAKVGSYGFLAVKIRLADDTPKLPLGAGGTVAIYTHEGQPVHVISKVTIRMKKWLLYVLPS